VKVTTVDAILASFRDGDRIALGGMLLEGRPNTLVRALFRSGASDLFLTSAPAASWDADLLIGSGRVARQRIPHISLACVGLAPAIRQLPEGSGPVVEPCDEALLLGGFIAANHVVPVQILDNMGTNDLVDDNELSIEVGGYRGVAPLTVDIALLHAAVGDERGNLVHFGSRWADVLIARSAGRVIAQVDRLVPNAAEHGRITVPGYLVDEIVEAPFGAHPVGSVGAYVADLDHLRDYSSEVSGGGLSAYIERYVEVSHEIYLERVGEDRLASLAKEAVAS
jgi:glutaconate CoA-transferase subunit A